MGKQITLLFFMLLGICATAQTINVKGIVKDAVSGEVLPGVSILIKGTVKGTETDFDGVYTLSNLEKGATLVFRYLGYKQQEVIAINGTLNVSLEYSADDFR